MRQMSHLLAVLPPVLSLRLALHMNKAALKDFFDESEVAPSFTPQEFLAALKGPLFRSSDRTVITEVSGATDSPCGEPDGFLLSDGYEIRLRDRDRVALVVLRSLFGGPVGLNPDSAAAVWVFELFDAATVLYPPQTGAFEDFGVVWKVYAQAVHYWFDNVLGSRAPAWAAALALLPNWSASLQELAFTAKDSLDFTPST
jgi:hypothetical protein